jgi:glycosyltransferase involved in cell wall biosynthesis
LQKNNESNEIRFCATATWMHKKTPDKKPELFIEALAQVQSTERKKIVLTMIGGGDKVDELKKLCKEKAVNAEFTGYIEKTEIAKKLQKADFFLHASTIETFGIVAAEALMCGTPVICSNVGALPEIINEANGMLCENTVESWVDGINMAISTSYNNELISKQISQRFGLFEIGQSIHSVLKVCETTFHRELKILKAY